MSTEAAGGGEKVAELTPGYIEEMEEKVYQAGLEALAPYFIDSSVEDAPKEFIMEAGFAVLNNTKLTFGDKEIEYDAEGPRWIDSEGNQVFFKVGGAAVWLVDENGDPIQDPNDEVHGYPEYYWNGSFTTSFVEDFFDPVDRVVTNDG